MASLIFHHRPLTPSHRATPARSTSIISTTSTRTLTTSSASPQSAQSALSVQPTRLEAQSRTAQAPSSTSTAPASPLWGARSQATFSTAKTLSQLSLDAPPHPGNGSDYSTSRLKRG